MSNFYNYSHEDVSYDVVSITRSGSTATATTLLPHNLEDGWNAIIEGADQSEYNITAVITVTGPYTFEYTVSGTPATPATGTITVRTGRYYYVSTEVAYQTDPISSLDIIPAFATATVPGAPGANQIAVYELASDTWFLTDDFRGDSYYFSPDYDEYIQEVVGPFPDTAVTSIPLAELKIRKIDLTYSVYLNEITKNITVSAVTYFGDFDSQEIIEELNVYYASLTTTPAPVYLPNQTFATLVKTELDDVQEAWAIRENVAIVNFQSLVSQINAAIDEAALDAIDIYSGWPA